MIFFLHAIYFLNVLTRMLFPMSGPFLAVKYGCSNGQLGTLYLLLATGFALSLFLSQFASAASSYQKVVSFSSISSGLLLLFFPWVETFSLLAVYLFSFGLFSGLFIPSAIAYLTSFTKGERIGRTLAFFSAFQTLAMILAPLSGLVFKQPDPLFFSCGLLSLFFGFLFFFFHAADPSLQEKGLPPSWDYFRQALLSKPCQMLLAIQILAVGLNIGVFSIAPLYFPSEKTLFWALAGSRALGIAGTLVSGWAIDRWGLRRSLIACLFLNSLFILSLSAASWTFSLLFVQGPLAISLTAMAHIGVSKMAVSPRKASLLSLFSSASFVCGAGLVPQIMGALQPLRLQATGFFALSFLTLLIGGICSSKNLWKREIAL